MTQVQAQMQMQMNELLGLLLSMNNRCDFRLI